MEETKKGFLSKEAKEQLRERMEKQFLISPVEMKCKEMDLLNLKTEPNYRVISKFATKRDINRIKKNLNSFDEIE